MRGDRRRLVGDDCPRAGPAGQSSCRPGGGPAPRQNDRGARRPRLQRRARLHDRGRGTGDRRAAGGRDQLRAEAPLRSGQGGARARPARADREAIHDPRRGGPGTGPPGRREGAAPHGGRHLSLHPSLPGGTPGAALGRHRHRAHDQHPVHQPHPGPVPRAGVGPGHAIRGRGALRAPAALPGAGPDLVQRSGDRRRGDRSTRKSPIPRRTSATSPSGSRSRCSRASRTTARRWTSTTRW